MNHPPVIEQVIEWLEHPASVSSMELLRFLEANCPPSMLIEPYRFGVYIIDLALHEKHLKALRHLWTRYDDWTIVPHILYHGQTWDGSEVTVSRYAAGEQERLIRLTDHTEPLEPGRVERATAELRRLAKIGYWHRSCDHSLAWLLVEPSGTPVLQGWALLEGLGQEENKKKANECLPVAEALLHGWSKK